MQHISQSELANRRAADAESSHEEEEGDERRAARRRTRRRRAARRRATRRRATKEEGDKEEGNRRKPMFMNLMKYTSPIAAALAIFKYQITPHKLFVDNVVPLVCFLASIVVYWLIPDAIEIFRLDCESVWVRTLRFAALASVVLSVLSEISLIFLSHPDSLVPLLIWIAMLVLFVTWPIFRYTYCKLICPGITALVHRIRCRGGHETEELSSQV